MASMVATLSPMAIQENGSRNKRKFRADSPLVDQESESLNYELSSDKFDIVHSHGNPNCCEMCGVKQEMTEALKLDLGLSCPSDINPCIPKQEIEPNEEFHDANWNDLTESELEGLVLSNLDTIFKSAIKKIIACGYNEEIATKAVLKSGLCYGCKDMVSNIVDNTLAFLSNGQEMDTLKEPSFEDLQQMEKYILKELVCDLKEIGPSFSNGDAMWCLLICDMNIAPPSAMGTNHTGSLICDGDSSKLSKPSKPISLLDATNTASITNNSLGFSKSRPAGSTPVAEEKFVTSRKLSGISKKEYILRQKSIHLEKHHRSKNGSRAGKPNSFAGLVIDKKLNQNKATNFGFSSFPVFNSGAETTNSSPNSTSSMHNTELSLSLSAKSSYDPLPNSFNSEAPSFNHNVIPTENSLSQWISHDNKDEAILNLVPKVRELENQLQEWTEWANQKVMQAARRLGKDKAELKSLKQEKEEIDRLKKEKQLLEENTLKKLSEMENALRKASGQVEKANATVRRLEIENSVIEKEMLAAKLRAVESGSSFQEALRREKSTMLKCQLWEKQKNLYQDELTAEKRIFIDLQLKLKLAEEVRNQLEARQKQEKKDKEEILAEASLLEKEKEQIENSTKSKEDTMKLDAENNLRKYKNEIQKLEKEISKLRLKTDSSKIAALKNVHISNDIKIVSFNRHVSEFKNYNSGVKRERECVMCLSEEMSVVFLPCAHQVLCTMCNELHEKQGMKDCPSCRCIIQQRVHVRYGTK